MGRANYEFARREQFIRREDRIFLRLASAPQGGAGPPMIAVIFEVWPAEGRSQRYLDLAAALKEELVGFDGFVSSASRA